MEMFESSFGMVKIEMSNTARIELSFVDENGGGGEAEAEICMQEYLDSLDKEDNGKFGKNEVGRAEIWENEDGSQSFVADIF